MQDSEIDAMPILTQVEYLNLNMCAVGIPQMRCSVLDPRGVLGFMTTRRWQGQAPDETLKALMLRLSLLMNE
jgi:hypothetical protein